MKHGAALSLGGGSKLVPFTITTDGSGDPTSTVYGPSITGAITVARTGAGTYTFTPNTTTYGVDKLAFWCVNVNQTSGNWVTVGSVNRTTGVLTVTTKVASTGTATNVVSAELDVLLIFAPIGY
jgi:Tfp pilus assembly protein FimT